MVYRFSWLAGTAGIGLAFWELSFLLRDSTSGTSWQIAILVSILLSAGITWTALAYKARVWTAVIANLVAYVLVVGLMIAPETLWGIFPTAQTLSALGSELAAAFDLLQYGVEPVRPVPGLIVLLSGLFWVLGFLMVAGLLNARPFVATITPLIIALQFVIIDRKPKGLAHLGVFISIAAFALLAVRIDERDHGTGRLARTNATTRPTKRPSPGVAVLVGATVLAGVMAVVFAGSAVPQDGVMSWRSPAGYVDGYSSSGTYNPYTDIRANLITQSNNPLFTAKITGDVDPTTIRWRMLTLNAFDGERWKTVRIEAFPLDEDPWIEESQRYRGPTTTIAAEIRIQNLSMPWLPTPITATNATTADDADYKALRTRRMDGSLYLPGDFTREGMEYAVTADVPTFDASAYAELARTESGSLSPLFATADEDGQVIAAASEDRPAMELDNVEFWTDYPSNLGSLVVAEARDITRNMSTNFEKALALENYFRQDGGFTYNTSVPSNYTTGDVSDWLFDESNPYRRNGYCEQFATTMALMARTLGIPSRVVLGFTPGKLVNEDTVLVMDRNAHSWVEIWIPTYGWMSFDPTPRSDFTLPTTDERIAEEFGFSPAEYAPRIPSGNLIDTSGGDDILDNPTLRDRTLPERDGQILSGGGDETGTGLPSWLPTLGLIAALVVGVVSTLPATKWLRRRRRARLLAEGDISAAWYDITERLADLGEPVNPTLTPNEAARSIDDAFVPLARSYSDALYGEKAPSDTLVSVATVAHDRAEKHLTTRYSRSQRLAALYRPTRLLNYIDNRSWSLRRKT
jgi:hypothetical protein